MLFKPTESWDILNLNLDSCMFNVFDVLFNNSHKHKLLAYNKNISKLVIIG